MELVTIALRELTGKDNIYSKEYTLYDEEGEEIKIPDKFKKLMGMSEAFGVTVKFEVTKNKIGRPHGDGRYVILLSNLLTHKKFDVFTEKEILLSLLRRGVIVPGARGWLSYNGENYRENELIVAFSKDLDKYIDIVYTFYSKDEIPDNIFDNFDELICTSCGTPVIIEGDEIKPCENCECEESETRLSAIKREATEFAVESAKIIAATSAEGFGIEEELEEYLEDDEDDGE